MNNLFSPLIEWLKKIWLPVSAFIGVIIAIYQFVQLWQGDFKTITIITLIVSVCIVLASLIFIGFSRSPSVIMQGRLTYRYPTYVVPARIGIGAIIGLLFIGVYIYFHNTTNVVRADIIIAEFDSRYASKTFEVATRIEDDLRDQLQRNDLTNIVVKRKEIIISDGDEAMRLAEDEKSKIVIWGRYDDLGIVVHMTFFDNKNFQTTTAIPEIPFENGIVDSRDVAFVIRDFVPENVSFLTFFAIGHILYLQNDYQEGYEVFNAAMNSIPSEVSVENIALMHFFKARLLEKNDENFGDAVCEYAEAIEQNPDFAEAYNNLGILLAQIYVPTTYNYLPDKFESCTNQFEYLAFPKPEDYFDKASELVPASVVPKYNKAAFIWQSRLSSMETAESIESELKQIIHEAPSTFGAYAILANIAFGKGNLDNAEAYYLSALELHPNDPSIYFGLGQVSLVKHDEVGALQRFQKAIIIAPFDPEVNLALVNLGETHRLSKILGDKAGSFSYGSPYSMATILKSEEFVINGDYKKAIEIIENLIYSYGYKKVVETDLLLKKNGASEDLGTPTVHAEPLERYLLYLLYSLIGDKENSEQNLRYMQLDIASLYPLVDENRNFIDSSFHLFKDQDYLFSLSQNNMTTLLTIKDLSKDCPSLDDLDWLLFGDSLVCNNQDILTNIGKVYQYFHGNLKYRSYYQSSYYVYMKFACPYLYTFNDSSGRWEMETAILYKLNGKEQEAIQSHLLQYFDGRLWIKEVEPEISYIDTLYIKITLNDGSVKILYPDIGELRTIDSEYLILRTGDEVLVNFGGYETGNYSRIEVVAKGYYIPLIP